MKHLSKSLSFERGENVLGGLYGKYYKDTISWDEFTGLFKIFNSKQVVIKKINNNNLKVILSSPTFTLELQQFISLQLQREYNQVSDKKLYIFVSKWKEEVTKPLMYSQFKGFCERIENDP